MAQFTALLDAVMRLDFDKILVLLKSGIDINCRDSLKGTVLHYLVTNAGLGESVHFAISRLVALGAKINARDMEGMTPLHCDLSPHYAKIAKEGLKRSNDYSHKTEEELEEMIGKMKIATLRHLVKLGADINASFNKGETSLIRAIQFGNVQAAETLIKLGVDVNLKITINWSLLHSAVKCGNKELIKCLVELGADMESKASSVSPLHVAIKTQMLDMIKVLVQNGADVNELRMDNITPIMLAFRVKNQEMMETLAQLEANINSKVSTSSVINEMVRLSKTDMLQTLFDTLGQNVSIDLSKGKSMMTALGMAVEGREFKMAEILVQNGAVVNVRYDFSCPPLFTAMRLGHVDMLTELVRLGANVRYDMLMENTTALMRAVEGFCPRMLDLLLALGGDVNLSYNQSHMPIQDAVSRGDITQVKTLVKLGADINVFRKERIDLLHRAFDMFGTSVHEQNSMEIIKILVQAGINLNKGKTYDVTLLHDAVKLGDTEMVHTLAKFGINMDSKKNEGFNPLFIAIEKGMKEVIIDLVSKDANINQSFTMSVTPLHDAVQLGDVDMVSTLIDCGADKTTKRLKTTALNFAITKRDKDTVKCLLESGADVNEAGVRLLHDAIDNFDLRMEDTLESLGVEGNQDIMIPPLFQSIYFDLYDITEMLLMLGADINESQCQVPLNFFASRESGILLHQFGVTDDKGDRFYPFHAACIGGFIDLVRLLILEGGDVNKCDYKGKMPLEYLPLVNTVDYHVIKGLSTSSDKFCERAQPETISVSECTNMKHSLCTPGIGDVKYILTPRSSEISSRVYKALDMVTTSCGGQLEAIGSAAEGTKVGLPTEMDLMIAIKMEKDKEVKLIDRGNGYTEYEYVLTELMEAGAGLKGSTNLKTDEQTQFYPKEVTGSAGFHNAIMEPFFTAKSKTTQGVENVFFRRESGIVINKNDRKACSQTSLMFLSGNTQFAISVDLVPCLHVNNWPEGAKTKTWLMDYTELRSFGYFLVPKPPHVKSDLANKCTELELQTLWKISFPHLETKHMQHLEQHVKDVYTTAKCLRNPDVCRILILDDMDDGSRSLPRPVDKYITSYLLKMCFFENVEYFLDNELSLEAMVCKVYQDLVVRLSEGFIPIFFLPKVNALGGGKLDTHKCIQVTKIMARFVRGLYLRDSDRDVDTTICDEDEEITVYKRKPTSVYQVQDIKRS